MAPDPDRPPIDRPAIAEAVAQVRGYHQRTKHLPGRFAPGPGYMDWANQPDPFRRFSGAPIIELPLVPDDRTPPYDALFQSQEMLPRPLSADSLGLFLELSLGLTAWKELGGSRWALRANPSSGNLHPTEGYAILPPVAALSDSGGVFHYAPREHALEQRCILDQAAMGTLAAVLPAGAFLVGLTSVHWREAWKYGERAYRYCQHDVGHALGAICFSAAALGWRVALLSAPSDAEVAALLGLDRAGDFKGVEAEHPDLIAAVVTDPAVEAPRRLPARALAGLQACQWAGSANQLSRERVDWPEISAVEKAAVKPQTKVLPGPDFARSRKPRPRPIRDIPRAAALIRQRRSAVDMDGRTGLGRDTFFSMLARTLPDRPQPPWTAVDFPGRIQLALFVHRIDGLSPGLYVLMRDPARLEAFRAACDDQFAWKRVDSCHLPLYALTLGDYRRAAAEASCAQAIAGDSAFSLGMIADFARTLKEDGAWAYRRLFWETGLIGQVLYLEAEAAGVSSTGMGCYFDDLVHQLLGLDLADDSWQSLYHFTVGGALVDKRLTTLPAYGHLPSDRFLRSRRGPFAL